MKNNFVVLLLQLSVFALSFVGLSIPSTEASYTFTQSENTMVFSQTDFKAQSEDFSDTDTHSAECEIDPEDDFPFEIAFSSFQHTSKTHLHFHEAILASTFIETPNRPPRA